MSKNRIIISVAVVICGLLIGLMNMNNSSDSDPSGVQGVAEEKVAKTVSAREFKRIIEENETNGDFVLLDLRTPQEYDSGYITDSRLKDFYDPNFSSSLSELDKTKTYAIYCNSGNRSGAALGLMQSQGFEKVYNLDGGIQAWLSQGYPVRQ
jgi:rhodanese-related sulfurtransferase